VGLCFGDDASQLTNSQALEEEDGEWMGFLKGGSVLGVRERVHDTRDKPDGNVSVIERAASVRPTNQGERSRIVYDSNSVSRTIMASTSGNEVIIVAFIADWQSLLLFGCM
jgi:hypothetical protein